MSIIYRTITRLESDKPLPANGIARAGSPRLTVEGRTFPGKVLLLLAIVTLGGGALLWQQDEPLGAVEFASPVESVRSIAAKDEQAVSQLSFVEVEAKFVPPLETLVPDMGESVRPEALIVQDATENPVPAPAEPLPDQAVTVVRVEEVDEIGEAIERARLSLSRGQYQQAIMALDHLVEDAPKRAEYWFLKGSAHLGLGQLEQADMAFASSQALAPDNVQIAIQQAIVKQEQDDHMAALQILQAALIEHSDVPEIYLNQGYSQLALGAQLEARRSFRTFLRMTEDRSLYVHNRSAVQQWLQQSGAI